MSRIGKSVVFWSRAFIQYMRMKSYSEFGVPSEYLNHSWSGPDAYSKFQNKKILLKDHPEVRHLWHDWKRERAKLHQIGFDNGQVLNRRTNEQFTFNTSIKHIKNIQDIINFLQFIFSFIFLIKLISCKYNIYYLFIILL